MKKIPKIVIAVVFIISLSIIFIGCGKKVGLEDDGRDILVEIEDVETDGEVGQPKIEGVMSPLSGLYGAEEKINRRPLVVVFDNQPGARPQAGLIDAEVAYEFLVEGHITRYLGVFLMNEPEVIGSIRSARPYFVEKALEYDGYFVHVGGSDQAFHDIAEKKVADIDATSRGADVFWRKSHKKIPHNMYSSHEALRKAAEKSKFRDERKSQGFKFHRDDVIAKGEEALHIDINYSKGFQPSYKFDKETETYLRYYNDNPHLDEVTKQQLSSTNIIIQEVNAKVVDDKLRLQMNTIGQGKGKYITKGKVVDITWKKDSYGGWTKYYDDRGNELQLNPGKTWVQVVNTMDSVGIS